MDAMFEFLFWLFFAFIVRQAVITADTEKRNQNRLTKKSPAKAEKNES